MTRYAVGLPNVGQFADPHALVELAVTAEEHGWNGVFIWDHVLYHDPEWGVANPVVVASAIAARTSRIRLGVLMTALPRRRAHVVARETATLDVLSGGRLVFGAGIGSMDAEYAAFGEDPDLRVRGRRLDESLGRLAAYWSGEPVPAAGGQTVRMLPTPVQRPRVPVWCAGRWPNRPGFRRAARWDGVVATFAGAGRTVPVPVPDFAEAVRFVAAERGSLDGFDVALEGWSEPATAAATVGPYVDAGLTWWIEAMGWWRGGVPAARDRIQAGPPRG
ncbi:LLM class flavin-dependent oxidoreductase [Planosporangium thailandense]|uniref:LLM class flavin-dependent oxidoreductase n=1 Tax=Planosporangium thailandense TaxID=765197 RepID=A0ABX0XXZ6_9ACTN|nr:LLM class flavin-dependent oxidoreductase [Planosporangium thailandense]NJC70905.1 LLM class flavin-dependent oxidoreductase [Planosporangium thailandense]